MTCRLNGVLALIACVLLASACGRNAQPSPATYTVKPGDTLYAIAWRHNLDYHVLARWNNLPADFRIEPGQILHLRPGKMRSAAVRPAPPRTVKTPPGLPPQPVRRPLREEDAVAKWVWPVDGNANVVRHGPTASQGLLIAGQEGAPVRAAAPGKVVYTGSGLLGFGNLVIVKHTEVFLSAYGHNRELKVKEGDTVASGQAIAEMGLGPGQKPALYFEIRFEGRPVDPLAYLPPRPAGGS